MGVVKGDCFPHRPFPLVLAREVVPTTPLTGLPVVEVHQLRVSVQAGPAAVVGVDCQQLVVFVAVANAAYDGLDVLARNESVARMTTGLTRDEPDHVRLAVQTLRHVEAVLVQIVRLVVQHVSPPSECHADVHASIGRFVKILLEVVPPWFIQIGDVVPIWPAFAGIQILASGDEHHREPLVLTLIQHLVTPSRVDF